MDLFLRNGLFVNLELCSLVLIISGFQLFRMVGPVVDLVGLEAPVMGILVAKVKAPMEMVEKVAGPFFHGIKIRHFFFKFIISFCYFLLLSFQFMAVLNELEFYR